MSEYPEVGRALYMLMDHFDSVRIGFDPPKNALDADWGYWCSGRLHKKTRRTTHTHTLRQALELARKWLPDVLGPTSEVTE